MGARCGIIDTDDDASATDPGSIDSVDDDRDGCGSIDTEDDTAGCGSIESADRDGCGSIDSAGSGSAACGSSDADIGNVDAVGNVCCGIVVSGRAINCTRHDEGARPSAAAMPVTRAAP